MPDRDFSFPENPRRQRRTNIRNTLMANTFKRADALIEERLRAAGISLNKGEKAFANAFSLHLIEGVPLSTMRGPQAIRDIVWQAVQDAAKETGYKLPKPKAKKDRRRKR